MNAPLGNDFLGAGVFTLDDALVGIVLRCKDRLLIASAVDLQSALQLSHSAETRLVDEFGLRVSSLDDALKLHFAVNTGTLVSEVWDNSPAERAGLVPGDVLLAIDDTPVNDAVKAQEAMLDGHDGDIPLKLLRHGRAIQLMMPNGSTGPATDYAGITLTQRRGGVPVSDIKPGSRAEKAGVRPGDILLAVNGYPLSAGSRNLSLLDSNKSAFVVVQRDDRTYGVLLP